MKTYLQAFDLWKVVNIEIVPPTLKANPTLAHMGQYNCDTPNKFGISSRRSSRVRKRQGAAIDQSQPDFENLKMKEAETLKQYSDRIIVVVSHIRLLRDQFADSRVVEKVITTLLERYE
ncbi:hypothetical protein PVK06_000853 [Gossypium arboreum]|uniref:Uncharacterized protein n=1 Tax=Gossypium arboreum TaxID=29729 RepID=A0ABR0R0N0_GOSAR|nr:hypothetical protein PVK06_000853 [Gossypium arboreum]